MRTTIMNILKKIFTLWTLLGLSVVTLVFLLVFVCTDSKIFLWVATAFAGLVLLCELVNSILTYPEKFSKMFKIKHKKVAPMPDILEQTEPDDRTAASEHTAFNPLDNDFCEDKKETEEDTPQEQIEIPHSNSVEEEVSGEVVEETNDAVEAVEPLPQEPTDEAKSEPEQEN